MNLWVGISPLIGAGSLEGFAVGATVSGTFFLAIAAPRRVRRWRAAAAGTCCVPVSASGAEAGGLAVGLRSLEAFGADAERVVQPRPGAQADLPRPGAEADLPRPGAQDDASWTSPSGRDGRAAAYRSRHRLGDPIPDRAARGGASADRTRRSVAFPRSAFRGRVSRDDAQPDSPFPDVASSDVAFPDGTFRSARQPEVRRLPRHAAPTVSFGTKVSGRVTGLFAAWPLAGGAPS